MLLSEAMESKLNFDNEKRQQLIAQARINELIYYELKKQGVTSQIDEDIGIDFIDTESFCGESESRNQSIESRNQSILVKKMVAEYR